MSNFFQEFRSKIGKLSERKILGFYFFFVTFLMVYQHSQGWAWDFSVYSLNAEYLFHEGVYMEWKRPPLLPTILGILQYAFSMRLSEYIFIVLNSGFFLYSALKLSKTYDISSVYLYVLVMSPFIIFYSALEGTELLFLSFLALILADLKSRRAGLWLGLAFLTRYTGVLFVFLLAFQKDIKKNFSSLSIMGLTVLPWFVFNYFTLGHPLASLADSYALDVVERGISTGFNPADLFLMTGIAIPLALYYLKQREWSYIDVVMSSTATIVVLRQLLTAIKVRRYLFDLSLPVAFLAVKGLREIDCSKKVSYVILGVYLVGSLLLVSTWSEQLLASPDRFQEASYQLGDCKTVSNDWTRLSYAGTPTGPLEPRFKSHREYVQEGYKIAIFENGSYTIKGEGCIEGPYNSTYISRLDEQYNVEICEYLPISTCGFEDWIGGVV